MNSDNLADIFGPPHKRSLADDVVDRLRQAIYSGRLAPDFRLREETLAEFLGVSRGPIREALLQLEREGLVIKEPNRGATVARLAREDLEEVYSLRMALELFAVRQAIRKGQLKHFDDMQKIVDAMTTAVERGIDVQEAARLDVEFHEIMYQAASHKRLYDFWSTLKPQIHIFLLARNVANPDFREYIIPAHQDILDGLRARDEARVVALTQEHLSAAYERILKSYPESEKTRNS